MDQHHRGYGATALGQGSMISRRSLMRATGAGLGVAAFGGLISACAGQAASGGPKEPGVVTIAANQGIPGLNPFALRFAAETILYSSLWSTLVRYGPSSGQRLEPGLAERWESSTDGRTYTFQLRSGLRLSNGKALDAEAVAGALRWALDPKTAWSNASMFPKINGVASLSGERVQIVLAEPSAALFTGLLATLPVIDVAGVGALNGKDAATSGPYKVKEFVPDDHVTLIRNDKYWGKPAPSGELRIVRAQDSSAAVTSIRSGDIDVLWNAPWQDLQGLRSSGLEVVQSANPSGQVIAFGDNTSAPFDDPRARRALVHAMNKKKIIETAYLGGVLVSDTNQPIPSKDPLFNSTLDPYRFDLDEAKRLFNDAGVREGATLTFWTTAGANPEWLTWGQILQSDLSSIGITLKIETRETNAWADGFLGKKFPGMIVPNQYIFASPFTLKVWTGGISGDKYDNSAYAEAVNMADQEQEPDARKALYWKAQEIYAEDAPSVILGQTSTPIAVQSAINGVWSDPFNYPHFEEARWA